MSQRQHEHFLRRAVQAQIHVQLAIAKDDIEGARSHLACAQRHLDVVSDCNDSIDANRRALEPGDNDVVARGGGS